MNQKLGLHECFLNEDDPYILFDAWMKEAEKTASFIHASNKI